MTNYSDEGVTTSAKKYQSKVIHCKGNAVSDT